MGRQPGNTKLSSNVTVRRVRVRGGNFKFRALRLDSGNFSWGSEVKRQLQYTNSCHHWSCKSVCCWSRIACLCWYSCFFVLQATTRKTRILDVVYNSSNNELVGALCPNAGLTLRPAGLHATAACSFSDRWLSACRSGHKLW